jgi:Ca2+-binding EF-hand superfamily protein
MDQEITLDSLRKMAERAGLKLSEDELQRLLPGVNRSKKQATELRELVAAGNEPASTFDPAGSARK